MMNGEPACTRGSGRCAESRRCSAGIFCRLGHGKLEEQTISAADRRLTDVTADHPLPEAFSRISTKVVSPFREYLQSIAERLKAQTGEAFAGILKEQTQTVREKTGLWEEDWDLFLQTLGHLGYLDARMQIRLLENGRAELAAREEKLQHQLPEQKKVWQSLGILGGAFLVVILI